VNFSTPVNNASFTHGAAITTYAYAADIDGDVAKDYFLMALHSSELIQQHLTSLNGRMHQHLEEWSEAALAFSNTQLGQSFC